MSPEIRIDFRIGSERYARRTWPAVPRVGDCVLLGAGKDRYTPDHNGDAMFQIKQVTWVTEITAERQLGGLAVICFIEHVEVQP